MLNNIIIVFIALFKKINRAQSINVYLGAHDINSQNEWQRIMYTTTVYIKHPNWNSQTNTADDIALIKLPVAINYNGI